MNPKSKSHEDNEMAYTQVFRRHELKYLISSEQKAFVLDKLSPYMTLDKYGKTTIRNIYFDTDSFLLIRRSIEKPIYKEKLRIRSYCRPLGDSVFVELKKKYKGVVYKRRIRLPEVEALDWISGRREAPENSQISKEIDYFIKHYESLAPRVFLSYEREAYFENLGGDLRITFDENILARVSELSLDSEPGGIPLLDEKCVLMEIKCSSAMPLWLARALSEGEIRKSSYSKYGTAYKKIIYKKGDTQCLSKQYSKDSLIATSLKP